MDDTLLDFTWYELQNSKNSIEISIDGGNSWQILDFGCLLRRIKAPPVVWYARMWLGDHGDGEYEVNVAQVTEAEYLTYEVPESDYNWYGEFVRWLGDWYKVEV